ncbi:hypothetical protein BGW42_007212 [Actinomortierella wolfii]|nr:hypothetical protein BGW42_007212 [Actinomortierella wolfii]
MKVARKTLVGHGYQIAIVILLAVTSFYFSAIDGYWTWIRRADLIFTVYNRRDWLMIPFVLFPLLAGHLLTLWSHYYRADQVYHESIRHVTFTQLEKDIHLAKKRNQKNPTHFWHRRWWGWTYKQWLLAVLIIIVNLVWFTVEFVFDYPKYRTIHEPFPSFGLAFGAASGYAVLACTAWILFLILRRSMLHALGWTYAELVPFHRWLGVLITFWSTTHTIGYLMYYIDEDIMHEGFNFTHERGLMNMFGVFAYIALLILALFSIPWIRRKLYGIFMAMHRVMTVLYMVGTMAHFPYYMMWYYVLPSFILFLLDRFVPKYIQTRTILPTATVTLDPNGVDIMRVTVRSRTPMKPYYPGDYILLQVPEIGTLYHPFTIASYYPEDPCAVTLYIRIYNESRLSWTPPLSMLGEGKMGRPVRAKARVDGIFGDRVHDYLESEVCVLFVAGVAITTFMALIKAIGAEITAAKESGEPEPAFRMYLICSFKTESELYAYGTFFTQITMDPRFTSWLKTRVFVTRSEPPRPQIAVEESGLQQQDQPHWNMQRATAEIPEPRNSTSSISSVSSTSSTEPLLPRAYGESALMGSKSIWTTSADEIICASEPTPLSKTPATKKLADGWIFKLRLPTFMDVNSAAEATRLAHLDLKLSALLIVVPLVFWFVSKGIYWEGYDVKHCDLFDHMPFKKAMYCFMTYSLIPGTLHFLVMSVGGYAALYMARKAMRKQIQGASRGGGPEAGSEMDDDLLEEEAYARLARECRERSEIAFERGRMQVEQIMHEFIEMGIGGTLRGENIRAASDLPATHAVTVEDETGSNSSTMSTSTAASCDYNAGLHDNNNDSSSSKKKTVRTATVLAGGPDSFVDRVEDLVKKVGWAVDFHRETWAP